MHAKRRLDSESDRKEPIHWYGGIAYSEIRGRARYEIRGLSQKWEPSRRVRIDFRVGAWGFELVHFCQFHVEKGLLRHTLIHSCRQMLMILLYTHIYVFQVEHQHLCQTQLFVNSNNYDKRHLIAVFGPHLTHYHLTCFDCSDTFFRNKHTPIYIHQFDQYKPEKSWAGPAY